MFRLIVILTVLLTGCSSNEAAQSGGDKAVTPGALASKAGGPSCDDGFEAKAGRCVDIDECGFVASVCGTPLAKCQNKPGGYECTCPRGYAGGGPLGIACSPRVVAGFAATFVIPEKGPVISWGGELGGVYTDESPKAGSHVPVELFGTEEIMPLDNSRGTVAVVTGQNHGCLLRDAGLVTCWGSNEYGQLGDGTTKRTIGQTCQVKGLTNVAQISAGASHTCAVRRNGELWCWGANHSKQIGAAAEEAIRLPVRVGNESAVAVGAGGSHTCALGRTGSVTCWGSNYMGELGHGLGEEKIGGPTKVILPDAAVTVFERGAILRDGRAFWWGRQAYHRTGENGPYPTTHEPTEFPGLADALSMSTDDLTKCVLRQEGTLWCIGGRVIPQRPEAHVPTPTRRAGLDELLVYSSGTHDCAADRQGRVWCWGPSRNGSAGVDRDGVVAKPTLVTSVDLWTGLEVSAR